MPDRHTHQFLAVTVFRDGDEAFDLARYFDADYDRCGPSGLAHFLGRDVEEIFPMSYDISNVASGTEDVVKGSIPLAPAEKLTEEELLRLAIDST